MERRIIMQTPYFLINIEELNNNLLNFHSALEKIWPNSIIAYSVKTNSLPWLLKYLKKQDVLAEVVSDEEYELSLLCGYTEEEIVFNGPIKAERRFLSSIEKGSVVNIDSKNELDIFKRNILESNSNIGIRVNVNTSIFDTGEISYKEEGFRFGFSEENNELVNAIDTIRFNDKDNRIGLHFHCNSVTRSLSVYRKIAEYAKYIIRKYEIAPSFIDIGGGFYGGVEGKPTASEYIGTIHEVLKDVVNIETTRLIVEPGSAIIASAVDFYTSVRDVKETNKVRIVTTDGSRINIDPLWKKKTYSNRIEMNSLHKNVIKKQIICGYTCMSHDRIMTLMNEKELSIGDRIIYEKAGSYSMTFGGPFIKYFPEVYVKGDNEIKLVRKRMNVKDYYSIQSI